MIKAKGNEILLDGCALIEASAGTGKTHTIQNLYLRMIAGWYDGTLRQERFLTVPEILVMTYTIAATEELKERIRKILSLRVLYFENRSALSDGDFNRLDELLRESRSLVASGRSQSERDQQIRNRIRNALLVFDDAAIFTIHGFCQRLLSQYAFESGILFNAEIRTDADMLIQNLLEDYLRSYCYPEKGPLYAALRKSPGALLGSSRQRSLTRELMTRPDLQVLGGTESKPAELERKIEDILTGLKQEYRRGLAGEMMFPEAGSADPALLEWKGIADVAATGEDILDILAGLNEHLNSHPDLSAVSGRFGALCAELSRTCSVYHHAVLLHAARWTREQFARQKEQENFLTFDDLLKNVLHAVRDSRNPLLNLVRKQYRAAVVDEFQDTDPEQYEIFKRLFGDKETGHILFFVGDPKQAIYGFRGGDTATYRIAREFVKANGDEHTLDQNFRSAEKLLNAVNDLFEKCPRPEQGPESVFADPAVVFQPVSSGKNEIGLLDPQGNEDPAPLKFRWLTVSKPDASAVFSLNDAVDCAYRACSEDIVALLKSDWRKPGTDASIQPGDIAVLVPDNADAVKIRTELKKRNIPCVIPKSENVFKSAAAGYLKTVLKAVISPANGSLVSSAMMTPLLGFTLDDMIKINASVSGSSSDQLNLVQEKMTALSAVWHQTSFLKMFQEMLSMFSIRSVLLKQNDGERILTDLLHLRDLIHQKISQSALSPAGVLSYLAGQELDADSEEKETMMETDREAVVISTIHSSKGLEYPVVMLPLMFKKSFSFESGRIYCYHDAHGRLTLNLSPDEDAVRLIEQERKQELMRLLYVALTRAKYSCYLYWGLISGKTDSGLYDQTAMDWLFPAVSGHDLRRLDDGLPPQLARYSALELVMTDLLTLTPWRPPVFEQENLILPKWNGHFDPNFQFTSFTGLAGHHGGADGLDYDSDDFGNKVEKPTGIFKLPAGAQTGNAWHDIMEEIDFPSFDPENRSNQDFIEQKLELFGVVHRHTIPEIRAEYVQLTGEMVRHVLNTPLVSPDGTEFALKDIPRSERLSELKFNYRFHQKVQTSQLITSLSDYVGSVFGEKESDIAIRKMTISGGCLNGALDLLFRYQGKFYIADWKSNRINGRAAGFSTAAVAEEMAAHTYYLQYLIYTVAVIKYLALHLHHPLSEAEYEELFGGVFYFFMRGVDSARPGQGVFTARPPYALIRNLEQLIG